jgi:hypothetical protein
MEFSPDEIHRSPKQELWAKYEAQAAHVTDRLGKEIDPGIKRTVVALMALGFQTSASCEGHLDHGLRGPWIDIGYVPRELLGRAGAAGKKSQTLDIATEQELADVRQRMVSERLRLLQLLSDFYQSRKTPFDQQLSVQFHGNDVRLFSNGVMIQEAFKTDEQAARLEKYRQEMTAFTEFAMQRFFGDNVQLL